ncbi:alpha/beta fold hydrolase [Rubrobacter tropicus]|uniref:Alpha/beta fold hydrolase n=1 Tax=Rubrobacter tropicus TaxID=2653851 RepID=A0A6G8QDT5_9ACTN|nr:alpha/beta fold hydrolase [Rubrobacter tropicus]QIN84665.1 alpha/beta fold hydrolase [Rubrobacter tropicus]
MSASIEEHTIEVGGMTTRYFAAGAGPPLVLLHGDGESAFDWSWTLPALARSRRVYAPDLPGSGENAKPAADYSPAFLERFAASFLDAVGVGRAAVVGSSLGGLVALRLALSEPSRVGSLVLVASSGLGRAVNLGLSSLIIPGYGDLATGWAGTKAGAAQRARSRARLLFARPGRAPKAWISEQYRLARMPGFLAAQLAALRAELDPLGQREVLLDELPRLTMPTLLVWGERDRILPVSQARAALARLPEGSIEIIPDCGHLPQVEWPDRFVRALDGFLGDEETRDPELR